MAADSKWKSMKSMKSMKKRTIVTACTFAAAILASGAGYGSGSAQVAGAMEPAAGAGQVHGQTARHVEPAQAQSLHGQERAQHEQGRAGVGRWHEGKEKSRRHGGGMREVAKLLGMSKDELKAALMSGKTMAELAKERGVDRQKVVDLIAARMQKRLDARLKDGDVTREEYDARKARIPELAARIVDEGMPKGKGKGMREEVREPANKPE